MSILKAREIRKMSTGEINKRLRELKLELAKNKAQAIIGGSPENPGKIKEIRRTIARIKTIQKEKTLIKKSEMIKNA